MRLLIGIEAKGDVPGPDNISRSLAVLGEEPHLSLLREIFDVTVKRLGLG